MPVLKKVRFLVLTLLISACASQQTPEARMPLMSESDYDALVEKNSNTVKIYDGFMNVLTVTGTLLTTDVLQAQNDQNARMYQWAPEQYAQEKTKTEESLKKESKVFISFFTPERKHDDLQKSNSHWKLFLDVGGKRYEGTATRWKSILVEVRAFYPYHTRWGTPYMITFPVPMKQIESQDAKLTLTGPVGSAQLDFSHKP